MNRFRLWGIGLLLLLAGCSTAIVPPSDLREGTRVAVLDHGRHSTLILPGADGTSMVRYTYGDWTFYALGREGFFQAVAALLWPTQAGLGRRELAGAVEPDNIRRRLKVLIDEMLIFEVEADRAAALRRRLDGLFHARRETTVYHAYDDLEFVHHPESYWMFRNSSQKLAEWLRELGCRTRGAALFSSWRLERPRLR